MMLLFFILLWVVDRLIGHMRNKAARQLEDTFYAAFGRAYLGGRK